MSEKELPTMPESAFNYAINYIKLDVIIKLMAEIVRCKIINDQDFNDTFLYLRTLHKEMGNEFDVLKEGEFDEEQMGGDQEADVNVPKAKSIHDQ